MQSQYLLKKIEGDVFYLLIFAIPVQARVILHSWIQPFNQWTSAYLYGTDILLAAIFVLWLARSWGHVWRLNLKTFGSSTSNWLRNSNFWLTVFLVISALSIFNSRIVGLSFYQLLKLAEFIGFYFYLKNNLGKVFDFQKVLLVIIASGLFQSIITVAQYLKQGSIGLWLLGESPLSVDTTGVAVFIADGEKYLRAYGTTPHPNILAAWLFMAIFAFYFWYLYLCGWGKEDKKPDLVFKYDRDKIRSLVLEIIPLIFYTFLLFGFFFTFSRVIIGLWVLSILILFAAALLKREFRQNEILKIRILNIFAVSVVVAAVFSLIYWPQVSSRIHISAQEEAVTQRVFYNKIAESTAVSNPLLGIGIGQFVPNFMSKFKNLPSNVFQPVHNLYLLIASETGFLGLGSFFLFLLSVLYNFYPVKSRETGAPRELFGGASYLLLSASLLLVGLFDHFLWTSQQGSFIFWMVLALLDTRS